MSFGGSPPPIPDPVPPPPVPTDAQTKQRAEEEAKKKLVAAQKSGANTVLTSPLGDTSTATTTAHTLKKTVLG